MQRHCSAPSSSSNAASLPSLRAVAGHNVTAHGLRRPSAHSVDSPVHVVCQPECCYWLLLLPGLAAPRDLPTVALLGSWAGSGEQRGTHWLPLLFGRGAFRAAALLLRTSRANRVVRRLHRPFVTHVAGTAQTAQHTGRAKQFDILGDGQPRWGSTRIQTAAPTLAEANEPTHHLVGSFSGFENNKPLKLS